MPGKDLTIIVLVLIIIGLIFFSFLDTEEQEDTNLENIKSSNPSTIKDCVELGEYSQTKYEECVRIGETEYSEYRGGITMGCSNSVGAPTEFCKELVLVCRYNFPSKQEVFANCFRYIQ